MTFETRTSVRDTLCLEERPLSCGIVIFGAKGDLTRRKLIPTLYKLHNKKLLPNPFFLLGVGRAIHTELEFRTYIKEAIIEFCEDSSNADEFCEHIYYHYGEGLDINTYTTLSEKLTQLEGVYDTGSRRIYYLSLPPALYEKTLALLDDSGLTHEDDDGKKCRRVIIEKPFGRDLNTALKLDEGVHKRLKDRQIYRIDHYLGKETVQNILMFRFANVIFEPLWNRQYIEHIQITSSEEIGIGTRGGYYDNAGALRDMFQNHMLQLLALVAMEPPVTFGANGIRDEKVKLLRAIRPFPLNDLDNWIVRGQYDKGENTNAYTEEIKVAKDSTTETFVAAKLLIDNWRWQGVPFYLRSGKRLKKPLTEIAIKFRSVPHSIFAPLNPDDLAANTLVLNIQPCEGIDLSLQLKRPGPKLCMGELTMGFNYKDAFNEPAPEAYERLLLDAMVGDQTLFIRSDDIQASWELFTPVLEAWQSSASTPELYPPASWGPSCAKKIIKQDGNTWRE